MTTLSSILAAFQRHWLWATLAFCAVLGSALAVGFVTTPIYKSQMRFIFLDNSPRMQMLEGFAEGGPFTRTSDPLENKMELVKTHAILNTAIDKYKLRNPATGEAFTPDELRSGLAIESVLGTDMVDMAFTNTDPQIARSVVTALAQTLIDDTIASNRARATTLREFIENKLPGVERKLKDSERRRQQYQKQSGSVEVTVEAQAAVRELGELEATSRRLQATNGSLNSQIAQLRRQLGGKSTQQAVTDVAVSADPDLQANRRALADLDAEIARQSAQLGERHPQMINLREQQKELNRLIASRVKALGGSRTGAVDPVSQTITGQMADLEARLSGGRQELASVEASIGRYRGRLATLPERQVTLAQLDRQVQLESASYNLLASRLEEAKIAEAQSFANVRVVDPASEPEKPVWPNFPLLAVAGTMLGLGAASGIIALLEAGRKSINSQQMQDLLQVPVLASLPLLESSSERLIHAWNRESYRMLCMNLRFLVPGAPGKAAVIVVSSAVANEGKSTVATNLARAMARAGRRTLIVDADLVRPSLSETFGLEGRGGLAEWLFHRPSAGSVVNYVQQTAVSNLDVLGAGSLQLPDSGSLLDEEVVDALIGALEPHYEQIIIDTPPMAGYAHGHSLAARSEGVLLVLRPGHADIEHLKLLKQTLDRNRIPLLGTVFNGIDAAEDASVGYYYDRTSKPRKQLLLPE
ncbi:GumC family protein [Gloeobacter morelensis]|uniref:non-specific protein-tyrosine kinase n=1 Tax=Gloeobacter morelensis MG652769 TaxID=2781736 RepID=A0ABY3PSG0_9CYAN|nr:polysaccharide biosynthesis tyrosine autokinase [Gloeobacter morelensis]UFP96567.1 polysaccharide biosynthesis tyrosine autokinase [Gloeobacter morelensis MG652769]